MTPLALRMETAPARRERRFRRAPLAVKLAIAFLGLVALVLLVNGAVDTYLTYNQAKRAALEVESEKARGAAERVGAFLADIQTQLGWTTGVEWGYAKLEQQRYDFIRLLRQAPAITALSYIDGHGKEQIAVSRLEPDAIASGRDFSADPRFVRAVADKIWFGPVEFRRGSEPYMTVALAHVGKAPGVTVADVNLKLVWDVVSAIHVGDKGFAYVVDDHGRLIAHPDLSLVLRDSDFSGLPQVAEAMKGGGGGGAAVAKSFDGAAVLTAFAIEPKTHWAVFVEQPLSEALAAAYATLARAGGLLGLGLLLAAVTGVALARRMAAPIRALQAGAERLGAGDLAQRLDIRTGDEIEALAGGFNRMAGRLQESYENLEGKVEERTKDLNEALHQQTATADVLKAISGSIFDPQAVLETLINSATALSGSTNGMIWRFENGAMHSRAFARGEERGAFVDYMQAHPQPPGRGSTTARVALTGEVQNIADVREDPDYSPDLRRTVGTRAALGVPMKRGDELIGAIVMSKPEAGVYPERIVELTKTFADQAVIAIENARLFGEVQSKTRDLEEALSQQIATAEVLKVISRSAFDLDPIFQALISTATRLCNAYSGAICIRRGEEIRYVAAQGHSNDDKLPGYLLGRAVTLDRTSMAGRTILSGRVEQIPDVLEDAEFAVPMAAYGNPARALLGAPLLGKDRIEGALMVTRLQSGAYPQRQVELLQTFADQAVIAIENARLFDEVQARTRDLEESLAQQTSTAEILRVISQSPTDARPVFESIVVAAARLLRCDMAFVMLVEGESWRNAAVATPEGLGTVVLTERFPVDPSLNFPSRAIVAKEIVSLADWSEIQLPEHQRRVQDLYGFQASLHLPFMREGVCVGVLTLLSRRPYAFGDGEIVQSQSFRDQAVIAIENARLFEEVQARTRDLEESLAQQTATADVLKVISRSAFDLESVFQTLVTSAVDLCNASSGTLCVRDGDVFRYRGMAGPEASAELQNFLFDHPLVTPTRNTAAGRTILSGRAEEIRDVALEENYAVPFTSLASTARGLLAVPLMGKSEVLGAIVVARAEPGAFPARHIEILRTFADQAVIAIENARLLDEVQARTRELETSLEDLRKAQDRLVQSEKLASLGQLTAGIAHEIKNPLNFVNNFASLSRELLEELRETLQRLPDEAKADADDLMGMIDSNLEKVASHGKRADSIVKNMLLHSREGSGERTRVNVNAMVEEALNLGYHGARAEKPGFNVTIEKALDPQAGEADLYLQEVTRVLLNLISNGFYASAKRKQSEGAGYEPTLRAATRSLGGSVEIRIRDNGTGIPDEVRDKMFNPFFTTKPAGEGTGLGLSLSHDIVVKQHGGTLDVETAPGAFTEFVITLPREGAGK